MAEQGTRANVKPRPNSKQLLAFSPFLYRCRNLVECFFDKIERFRVVTTRSDKYPDNFLARVKLTAARIWLRNSMVRDLARMLNSNDIIEFDKYCLGVGQKQSDRLLVALHKHACSHWCERMKAMAVS